VHVFFVRTCVYLKRYSLARATVSQVYLAVDRRRSGILPQEVILFFYYGGCVNLALKRYDAAIDLLEQAMGVP
jgi:hypothetical protein